MADIAKLIYKQNALYGGGFSPETQGSTGQILTKTATGYDWDDAKCVWDATTYVTQAEYDALPSTKLTNNVNYGIYEGDVGEETVTKFIKNGESYAVGGGGGWNDSFVLLCYSGIKGGNEVRIVQYNNVFYRIVNNPSDFSYSAFASNFTTICKNITRTIGSIYTTGSMIISKPTNNQGNLAVRYGQADRNNSYWYNVYLTPDGDIIEGGWSGNMPDGYEEISGNYVSENGGTFESTQIGFAFVDGSLKR